MSLLWTVGSFFIMLSPIILVHEYGHFLLARLFNIKVDEFGLGFPPRAVTLFERNGTVFSLNWIPLGGFVRPAGEDDPNVEGGLASASILARFSVLIAGAVFNFILAFLIFFGAFLMGVPQFEEDQILVEAIGENSPAEAGGIMVDDIILFADGEEMNSFEALGAKVREYSGRPLALVVLRDGEELSLSIRPRAEGEYDPAIEGPIGIRMVHPRSSERLSMGVGEAAKESVASVWGVIEMTFRVPSMISRGEISAKEARPVSVIGISQMAGAQAKSSVNSGEWFNTFYFMAVISVALGFTNLLPIPALDGGRLVFVLLELVRGRRINPEHEGMVHVVGMVFLLGLMLILMIQDVINPIV